MGKNKYWIKILFRIFKRLLISILLVILWVFFICEIISWCIFVILVCALRPLIYIFCIVVILKKYSYKEFKLQLREQLLKIEYIAPTIINKLTNLLFNI